MPRKVLTLLGGALAVAILVAGASVASGSAAPAGKAAGFNCDRYDPYSDWGHDWWGRDGDGRYWHGWNDGNGYFDGSAYDRGCGGDSSSAGTAAMAPGRVDRVMVAAKRVRRSGCQHLLRSGRLSRTRSCGDTHWMRAQGTRNWRLDIERRLPTGRYRLHRRAVDESGNREPQRMLHLSIR